MDRRTALRWLGVAATAIATADIVALLRWPSSAPALRVEPAPTPELELPDQPGASEPRPPKRPRRLGGRTAEPTPADDEGSAAAPTSDTGQRTLAVVCRREWGARPPAGSYASHRLRGVTVHHTAVYADEGDDAAARVRSHQEHHLASGFTDLAYHFVISRDGRVFEGRPVDAPGETFTDYDPTGHFLPCLEGNFDEQEPTQEQLEALAALLAWAAQRWGLHPSAAVGHRALAATSCPGDALHTRLENGSVQRTAQRVLAAGRVRLTDSCA